LAIGKFITKPEKQVQTKTQSISPEKCGTKKFTQRRFTEDPYFEKTGAEKQLKSKKTPRRKAEGKPCTSMKRGKKTHHLAKGEGRDRVRSGEA